MKSLIILSNCLFLIIACHFKLSLCWGEVGHRTSAAIAQTYLKKTALDNINKILKSYTPSNKVFQSIIDIATYADEMRPQNTWSSAYHYINMDPGVQKYNEATQCKAPGYCIVKALQNYTTVLKDRKITDINTIGEALSFTIHLMGDLFQPLHVGNPADSGGNGITVKLTTEWKTSTKSTNLHSLWDTYILQHWINTEVLTTDLNSVYVRFIAFVESDPVLKNEYLNKIPDIVTMTEENRVVSIKDTYGILANYDFTNLPLTYYTKVWPTVKTQVMKSGLQMARLLNDIFDYV